MVGHWCPPDTQSDIYAALTLYPECSSHTQSQSPTSSGLSGLFLSRSFPDGAFKMLHIHSAHQNVRIGLVTIISYDVGTQCYGSVLGYCIYKIDVFSVNIDTF